MSSSDSVLLRLIEADEWGEYSPLVASLKNSLYWDLLLGALRGLKTEELYISHVHGIGHVERTMMHGAFCAMADALSGEDARLLMLMCSYHDTGRESDWLDNAHGLRSSLKLQRITGLTGEELKIAMAGIEAHSVGDGAMDAIISSHAPADTARARVLAELLKDADGLDRVRINDLDPRFLRREASRARADFARYLFDRYSALDSAGGKKDADGFELSTITALRRLISESFASGRSCAQTALIALGNMTGVIISRQLLDAAAGFKYTRCGMAEAGVLMLGLACSMTGRDAEEAARLCLKYTAAFEAQYGSVMCSELSPAASGLSSCESLAVETALFTFKFISDEFSLPLRRPEDA
ncbi:MAG: C_GCAxxG_C_C family protein [Oscillospiraceae bacterium]|nr:C_GCAxxG_C_C family protein [Oscillospiraceae bacterium]